MEIKVNENNVGGALKVLKRKLLKKVFLEKENEENFMKSLLKMRNTSEERQERNEPNI